VGRSGTQSRVVLANSNAARLDCIETFASRREALGARIRDAFTLFPQGRAGLSPVLRLHEDLALRRDLKKRFSHAGVSRIETATRNPMITEQHTIINHLKGYRKFYFTGGSAGWANMRALVKYNIPDLELFEEGSFTEPEVDVWGISDLSLFREVDKVLSAIPEDEPFYAYIQTAGNHRPFTIPEDNDGFEIDPLDEEVAHAHGFTTTDQYNAVRLLDHTIGRFLEMAEKSGYLDRTLLVMFCAIADLPTRGLAMMIISSPPRTRNTLSRLGHPVPMDRCSSASIAAR